MFESIFKIKGVAYSGGILNQGDEKYVIDIESLKDFSNKKIFIKEEHVVVGSIGDAGPKKVKDGDKLSIEFDGDIFNYDDSSKRVAHQLSRGLEWQASIGLGSVGEEIKNFTGTVNGIYVEDVTLLKGGDIKEVSLTLYPADEKTSVGFSSFYFTNKKEIKKTKEKKQMEFMTKAQWMEFACACGGNTASTPRDLEKKFQDLQEDSAALEEVKEVEAELKSEQEKLKEQIAQLEASLVELNEQLKAYTDAEGVELDEQIEEFSKKTGKTFSDEEKKMFKSNKKMFSTMLEVAGIGSFNPKMRKETETGRREFRAKTKESETFSVVEKAKKLAKAEGITYSAAVQRVIAEGSK